MASASAKKVNYRTYGSLAYDVNVRAEEHALTGSAAEFERRVHAEPMVRPAPKAVPQTRTHAVTRPAVRVSALAVVGSVVIGFMLVMILMSYVQLTAISSSVVSMKSELAALEQENISLTSTYERVFDKSSVKEAAEAAGMTKPSPSQIYYIDLSSPDTVVLHQEKSVSAWNNVADALGRSFLSVVEYFN